MDGAAVAMAVASAQDRMVVKMMRMKTTMMQKGLWLLGMLTAVAITQVRADSISTDAIINVPAAQAWSLFTSEDGLKSLGYAQTSVTLALDGTWQTRGGNSLLAPFTATIQSFDPEHMLSLRSASAAGAPSSWLVVYFTALGDEMTQLRWVRFHDAAGKPAAMTEQQQVRQLFDQLIRRYAPECEVCKAERELGQPVK